MNAGMFDLPGGQAGRPRKWAGSVGKSYAHSATMYDLGVSLVTVSLTSGVRTRVLSINGRGAIRALAMGQQSISAGLTLELFIDGAKALSVGPITVNGSGPQGIFLLGNPRLSSGAAWWDYVPFDSSIELFATGAVTDSLYSLGYAVDIHQ